MSNTCAICKKSATQSCSACNQVYYCCKDHQRNDWKNHKKFCAPYKILTDPIIGRYVVATKNINQGELIMKKTPLILGPKIVSSPLCLGCHKKLFINTIRYNCSKCKWPLCGKCCENSIWHQMECELFTKTNFYPKIIDDQSKQSVYSCIVPLRSIILKQNDKKKFETLMGCQSHLNEHLNTSIYKILRSNLVPLFIDVLKLDTNEEEILKICSIFDTNSFEVRDIKGMVLIRGLYPIVGLLSHSCKHNTKHCYEGDDFQLLLRATVPIKKGETITTTYTQTLWGTTARRSHLKQSKLFDCTCLRCSDPAEFGTYAGSIYCTQCSNGTVDSPKMISENPLDQNSNWKCENCDYIIAAKQIIWGNDALRKEILNLDKRQPQDFEMFLEKYQSVLHPTNWHFLEVKYALSQMYGNLNNFMLEDLTPKLLQRKIDLCFELLEVADALEPGYSRFRGSLLYDLQAAMVIKAKADYAEEKITKEAAEDILNQALEYLKEAAEILKSEPDLKENLDNRLKNLQKILEI